MLAWLLAVFANRCDVQERPVKPLGRWGAATTRPSIGIRQTLVRAAVYGTGMPRCPLRSYEEESRVIAL
ncbi:hypothetical protein [Streptomyces sp. NPDC001450]